MRALYTLGAAPAWLDASMSVEHAGFAALLSSTDEERGINLELQGELSLGELDGEAGRIAAVIAMLLRRDVQATRVDPKEDLRLPGHCSAQTMRIVVDSAWLAEQRSVASRLLASADPRLLPGWDSYLYALASKDGLTRFTLLWAVVDLLVEANHVGEVDAYLHSEPHSLPRAFPGKNGAARQETFPTFCRQRVAHAYGRRQHWDGSMVDDCEKAAAQLAEVIDREYMARMLGV